MTTTATRKPRCRPPVGRRFVEEVVAIGRTSKSGYDALGCPSPEGAASPAPRARRAWVCSSQPDGVGTIERQTPARVTDGGSSVLLPRLRPAARRPTSWFSSEGSLAARPAGAGAHLAVRRGNQRGATGNARQRRRLGISRNPHVTRRSTASPTKTLLRVQLASRSQS
jgi:hypothetical protein